MLGHEYTYRTHTYVYICVFRNIQHYPFVENYAQPWLRLVSVRYTRDDLWNDSECAIHDSEGHLLIQSIAHSTLYTYDAFSLSYRST